MPLDATVKASLYKTSRKSCICCASGVPAVASAWRPLALSLPAEQRGSALFWGQRPRSLAQLFCLFCVLAFASFPNHWLHHEALVNRWHETDACLCGKWGPEGPRYSLLPSWHAVPCSCTYVQGVCYASLGSRCVTKAGFRAAPGGGCLQSWCTVRPRAVIGEREELRKSVRHCTCPHAARELPCWGNGSRSPAESPRDGRLWEKLDSLLLSATRGTENTLSFMLKCIISSSFWKLNVNPGRVMF